MQHWVDSAATVAMAAPVVKGIGKAVSNGIQKGMPKLVKSKVFSHNGGYGFKKGNFQFLYQEPNVGGGAFIDYRSSTTKWRIEWDELHSFHFHYGFGKQGRIHRKISLFEFGKEIK